MRKQLLLRLSAALLLLVAIVAEFAAYHEQRGPQHVAVDATEPVSVPVQAPAVPPPAPAPVLDPKSTAILELFNPTDASLTQQLNESQVNERVEQLFVSSFVLVNCGFMTQADYETTYRAMAHYVVDMGLSASLQDAALRLRNSGEAARASYGLIYGHSKCDDARLPPVAESIRHWSVAYLAKQP